MKKLLLVLCVVFAATIGNSQDLKIGVRTGLGYYKLIGELETNETQKLVLVFTLPLQVNIILPKTLA